MQKTDLNIQDTLKLIDESDEFASELATAIEESVIAHHKHTAYIESAIHLSESEIEQIKKVLKTRFKKDLILEFRVNPHLLGGFRVTVGDWKLDATLLVGLEQMRQQIIKTL